MHTNLREQQQQRPSTNEIATSSTFVSLLSVFAHQSTDVALEDGEPVEEDGAVVSSVEHGTPSAAVRLAVVGVAGFHIVAWL